MEESRENTPALPAEDECAQVGLRTLSEAPCSGSYKLLSAMRRSCYGGLKSKATFPPGAIMRAGAGTSRFVRCASMCSRRAMC